LESTGGDWEGKVEIEKYRRRLKRVGGDRKVKEEIGKL
jgi:hypothetical protein